MAWAQGADRGKAAQTMAATAMKAYQDGNYERASELFLNAWRTDPANSGLLYNAARAAHLHGKLDRAEEHYREFMKQEKREPALEGKAKGYLDELRLKRAEAKADEAATAQKANDPVTAAQLYRLAADVAPERVEYAFRAAKAEFQAGRAQEARKLADEYLKKAPADAPDRPEAQALVARIDQPVVVKPAAVSPAPAAAPGSPTVSAAPGAPSRTPAWIALCSGAALAGAGVGLYFMAAGADADLEAKLAQKDKDTGLVSGIGYDEAVAERDRIGTLKTASVAAIGVGAAALGGGGWLFATSGPKTAMVVPHPVIAPNQVGVLLAVQFR
jgi:tetratricopeptide (TPR) repeat protein